MQHVAHLHSAVVPTPHIRRVAGTAPLHWLSLGWTDFRRAPVIGLAYGFAIALIGLVVTYASWSVPVLVMSFVSGFLLIAPLIAIGLYEVSRRIQAGEQPRLRHALTSWQRNGWAVVFIGVVLGVVMIAWGRLTGLLAALTLPVLAPDGHLVTWATLTSVDGLGFLGLFTLMGAVLAGGVFAMTAVSIPMLLDRPVDAVTAVATSLRAVGANWPAMLLWAGLIVGLTAVGFATLYVGLIVIAPVLAHATWHAYRQTVES
jgi:uncharacterized membrane protein